MLSVIRMGVADEPIAPFDSAQGRPLRPAKVAGFTIASVEQSRPTRNNHERNPRQTHGRAGGDGTRGGSGSASEASRSGGEGLGGGSELDRWLLPRWQVPHAAAVDPRAGRRRGGNRRRGAG